MAMQPLLPTLEAYDRYMSVERDVVEKDTLLTLDLIERSERSKPSKDKPERRKYGHGR